MVKKVLRKNFKWIVPLVLFCLAGSIFWYTQVVQRNGKVSNDNSLQAKIAEAAQIQQETENTGDVERDVENIPEVEVEDNTDTEMQEKFYATSHKEENPEPVTDAPVRISDIYAEKDSIVFFHCYYPDAVKYTWEIYDMKNGWQKAASEDVTSSRDELNREISSLQVLAEKDNDVLTVRCISDFETKESVTDTASLHILEKIVDISADDFTSDSGQYISTKDIPFSITYQDGSKEEVTGLNNIYFLDAAETSEYSTSVSGNAIETITTVITAHDYFYMEPKEREVTLRYQGKEYIDIPIKLIGEDLSAPVISQITISEYTISNVDKPVPVTVSIQAEDNSTSYPNLLYAFLPEGEEIKEDSWTKKASFDADITQNGTWIAYCKDESGNVGKYEKDIIAVDNKAPVMSVKLENESWCKKNKIIINATDALSVEYNFYCPETGEESGWTSKNEYEVTKNSTWQVKARDAVGNLAEQEITIDNIDNQMPVINNITEKKEGATNHEMEEKEEN